MSDRTSQALAQGVPPGVLPYRALADHRGVPHTTLHHRARGRRSIEQKAESQQYLYPWEEKAFVKYLIQMSDLGHPVRIKYIRSRQELGEGSRKPASGTQYEKRFRRRQPYK